MQGGAGKVMRQLLGTPLAAKQLLFHRKESGFTVKEKKLEATIHNCAALKFVVFKKKKKHNKKHLWQRRTGLTLPTELFRGYLLAAQFLPTEENR